MIQFKIIKTWTDLFFPDDWNRHHFCPKSIPNPTRWLRDFPASYLFSTADEMLQYHIRAADSQAPGDTAPTHTRTHTLGWMGLPISRADCSPILGCAVLSHNSVTHTPSFAVSGAYQPPSSQETLLLLPLFYLIMHLHTLANKPSTLKSAMQTCAWSARGACWQQGEKIVPVMALTLAHMRAWCVNDLATERKKERKKTSFFIHSLFIVFFRMFFKVDL